jgi:selenide,water dikinase
LKALPAENDPRLLVGRETYDDAAVYRLTSEIALIQTVDFFTPIVDDPFDFGRIAAANALSDVYAMGGRPLMAMNIVCFPVRKMDKEILKQMLLGGIEKVHEAGALLVGGHSVEDTEIKYGLSVSGTVHPDKILTNAKAQAGDALILTKPLGTGVLATAIKAGLASPAAEKRVIEVMAALNKTAAEVMSSYPVNACTDITGFGLLGHGLEMATASKVTITIYAEKVPLLAEALEYVALGMVPAGSFANRNFCAHQVRQLTAVDPMLLDLLADAQTSGGLLISLPESTASALLQDLKAHGVADAAIIGRVSETSQGMIELA